MSNNPAPAHKLHRLTDVARTKGVTRRSVRRAAAEGRLTIVQLGDDDALGRPTRLRIVGDAKLRNLPAPRYRKPSK